MSAYIEMVAQKRRRFDAVGFDAGVLHLSLFPHQADIVRWAARLGRAAVFADTGLGKTRMQVEWARLVAGHSNGRVLILAPLAVSEQTIAEAASMGVEIGRPGSESPLHVVNYERLHQIDPAAYAGVVLDESSILKSYDGSTRTALIDAFARTPYRLACTATPAPNDHTELGNHAEFLGVCTRQEMLAEYFVHDNSSSSASGWRLKGHARRGFWEWVSSWAVVVRKPSDLGHDDSRYDLPALRLHDRVVKIATEIDLGQGTLFTVAAQTLGEQRVVRRESVGPRAEEIVRLIQSESVTFVAEVQHGPQGTADRRAEGGAEGVHAGVLQDAYGGGGLPPAWLIWCELNDEQDALERHFGDLAFSVRGTDTPEEKTDAIMRWLRRERPIMISKVSILGFGLNFQHCSRMIFAGLTHSYEQFYQAVRRCWRFGQAAPVDVHLVQTDADGAIAQSLKRKAEAADEMAAEMVALIREHQMQSVRGLHHAVIVSADATVNLPSWL